MGPRGALLLAAACCLAPAAADNDLYKVLGLTRGSDLQSIKQAYKKLAKRYHPDVNKESGAREQFVQIQKAYNVLSDPDKKRDYDEMGYTGEEGPGERPRGARGGFNGDPFGRFGHFGAHDFGSFRFRRPQAEPIMSETFPLRVDTWHRMVQPDEAWLVQFYVDGSELARDFSPEWEALAKDLAGIVKLGRVNLDDPDENRNLFWSRGLHQVPAFLFIHDSQERIFRGDIIRGRRPMAEWALQLAAPEDVSWESAASLDGWLCSAPHAAKAIYVLGRRGESGLLTADGIPAELISLQRKMGKQVRFAAARYDDEALRSRLEVKEWGATLVLLPAPRRAQDGTVHLGTAHRKTGGLQPLGIIEDWVNKHKQQAVPKLMLGTQRICSPPRPYTADASMCLVLAFGADSGSSAPAWEFRHYAGEQQLPQGVQPVWLNCHKQPGFAGAFGLECPAKGHPPAAVLFATARGLGREAFAAMPAGGAEAPSAAWGRRLSDWAARAVEEVAAKAPRTPRHSAEDLPFSLAEDEGEGLTWRQIRSWPRWVWRRVQSMAQDSSVTWFFLLVGFLFLMQQQRPQQHQQQHQHHPQQQQQHQQQQGGHPRQPSQQAAAAARPPAVRPSAGARPSPVLAPLRSEDLKQSVVILILSADRRWMDCFQVPEQWAHDFSFRYIIYGKAGASPPEGEGSQASHAEPQAWVDVLQAPGTGISVYALRPNRDRYALLHKEEHRAYLPQPAELHRLFEKVKDGQVEYRQVPTGWPKEQAAPRTAPA